MKRRQLYIIELEPGTQNTGEGNPLEFIENFQTAILLSLLEDKQLTKWQFDFCVDELKRKR